MRRLVGRSAFSVHNSFTIVELLAVISILSIIGMLTFPRYHSYADKARLVAFQLQNQEISHQYMAFVIERDYYPETVMQCTLDSSDYTIMNTTLQARENFDALIFFRCSLAKSNPSALFQDAFAQAVFRKKNLKAFSKPQLNGLFPFAGNRKPGCILTSLGPDNKEEVYSRNFPPQIVQYNPSNGISSRGDIFYSIPENEFLKFSPVE